MHRRGVGIAGLQKKQLNSTSFQKVGTEVKTQEAQDMKEQMIVFKKQLEEFAKKYKKEINKNPEFRSHFQNMCTKIGVDPLASNKGFWAEVLGVGDFYYELAVQIIEICLKTRPSNGGLIDVEEMCRHLQTHRKQSQPISADDIKRASEKIKILGSGFQLITIGSKKLIQSVPVELSNDHTTIIVLAQKKKHVTKSEIKKELMFADDRIDRALDLLVQEGIAWVDDQHPSNERAYWFPSLFANSLKDE